MSGSYVPLAATLEERQARGDPRPSILERYADRAQYLGLVAESAMELIDEGFLLNEDLANILQRAARHWDYRITGHAADSDAAQSSPDPRIRISLPTDPATTEPVSMGKPW